MDWLIIALIAILIYLTYTNLMKIYQGTEDKKFIGTMKNVLLIIAHPDDECMFFSPTIISLTRLQKDVRILCLSSGNFYGQGRVRKKELIKSCGILGIPSNSCTLIEHKDLPDDPTVSWDRDVIGTLLLKELASKPTDTVLTFDADGVSSHPNHCDIYHTLMHLQNRNKIPKGTTCYALDSVNIFRKYCGAADILFSLLSSKHIVITNLAGMFQGQNAMRAHKSQFVWFRMLYIAFSRYTIINTWKSLKELAASSNIIVEDQEFVVLHASSDDD